MPETIIIVALVASAILVILSLFGVKVQPPAPWLESWTKWIATVVAIVVSARVLWTGAALLQEYLIK